MKKHTKLILMTVIITQSSSVFARGRNAGRQFGQVSLEGSSSNTRERQSSSQTEEDSEEVVVENACDSETYCVHSSMPLYSQADSEFLSLIGQSSDLGFCGAGASAMIFKTYANNQDSLDSSNISSALSDSSSGEIIYQSGVLVGTNFTSGGTSTNGIKNGFSKFLSQVSGSTSNLVSVNNISSSSDAL